MSNLEEITIYRISREFRIETKKRSGINDDIWNEPSTGVKIGWALESLLNPIASYRNRAWLYHLTGQVEKLAKVTKKRV